MYKKGKISFLAKASKGITSLKTVNLIRESMSQKLRNYFSNILNKTLTQPTNF